MDEQMGLDDNNRKAILFMELAGLLHDLGKLSEQFLRYRQTWQEDPEGWTGEKDPHKQDFLDKHEKNDFLKPELEACLTTPISKISSAYFGEADFSIKKAIQDHHKDEASGHILKMLKAADAKDAAHDRNNPLFSAEQKKKIYRSNVFGFEEGRELNPSDLKEAREELYRDLLQKLPNYLKTFDPSSRDSLLSATEKAFSQGLADTTRPQNDTTLWEHAYAVASILKIVAVHNLFHPLAMIPDYKAVRFGILGFGWDGLGFISQGQKIGDIVGRKTGIEEIKNRCREIVESRFAVGNRIYEDDNGIFFIVPASFNQEPYNDLRNVLLKEVHRAAASHAGGELQVQVVDVPDTDTLTSIVDAIEQARKQSACRYASDTEAFAIYQDAITAFADRNTVCPVCRLRPVTEKDSTAGICAPCQKRRQDAAAEQRLASRQTVFIDEIATPKQGAALVVARFGLNDWLDGTMVRSLFVTEARGIEEEIKSLGKIPAFKEEKEDLQSYFNGKSYNYQRIKKDIDSFINTDAPDSRERAQRTAFLYAHGRPKFSSPCDIDAASIGQSWQAQRQSAMPELRDTSKEDIFLYNLLMAKSPTPSTILDVWTTTRRFFEKEVREVFGEEDLFTETHRLRLTIRENPPAISHGGTLEAEITSRRAGRKNIELIWRNQDNTFEIIGEQFNPETDDVYRDATIRITDKEYNSSDRTFTVTGCTHGTPILPYRIITRSPCLFLAIVPADKALAVTEVISARYTAWFGKVQGRLPFSIGNLFFRKKMPMFVVLDAAKKMVRNFERLAEKGQRLPCRVAGRKESGKRLSFQLSTSFSGNKAFARETCWNLPVTLGNNQPDYHHAYFTVENTRDKFTARPSYFPTVAGDVVHFSDIEPEDTLRLFPNYYDFEFLDSNSRRHSLAIDRAGRRRSVTAAFRSRPFFLDELPQKLKSLWSLFSEPGALGGMTDTKLRNMQALWLDKYREWDVDLDQPGTAGFNRWVELVVTTVAKEFPDLPEKHLRLISETIQNGLFFDMLELYCSILKEKVQKVQQEKESHGTSMP